MGFVARDGAVDDLQRAFVAVDTACTIVGLVVDDGAALEQQVATVVEDPATKSLCIAPRDGHVAENDNDTTATREDEDPVVVISVQREIPLAIEDHIIVDYDGRISGDDRWSVTGKGVWTASERDGVPDALLRARPDVEVDAAAAPGATRPPDAPDAPCRVGRVAAARAQANTNEKSQSLHGAPSIPRYEPSSP